MGAVSAFTVGNCLYQPMFTTEVYISNIYCFYNEFRKSYDVIIAYLVISRQSY